jgi:hypothetical protein
MTHPSLRGFLLKYFFILKAAADGWRVSYIGGNRFEFHSKSLKRTNSQMFANEYINKLFL